MTDSNINDGGPAFPMQNEQAIHAFAIDKVQGLTDTGERDRVYMAARAEAIGGMTLRDYFAAKALPSIYTVAVKEAAEGSGLFQHEDWRVGLALDAYSMADAMLVARAKGGAA